LDATLNQQGSQLLERATKTLTCASKAKLASPHELQDLIDKGRMEI